MPITWNLSSKFSITKGDRISVLLRSGILIMTDGMSFSTLPWTPRSPHNPILITPILELSRKFGIDRMREQIHQHLESDWPQTLQDWDKLESNIELMANGSDVQRIDDYFPEPASAIKLARQFDFPSILPAAFYHLSRLSILDDWDKTHADPALCIQNPTKRTARWELLSAKDFRCLLLGKEELAGCLHGFKTGQSRHKNIDLLGLGKRDECNVGEEAWKNIISNSCSQSADPLTLIKSSITSKVQHCPTCAKALRAVRAQIWERLGNFFHLKDE